MADRAALLRLAGPILTGYLNDQSIWEINCNDNMTCFVKQHTAGGQQKTQVAHPGIAELERFLVAVGHECHQDFREAKPHLSVGLETLGWRIEAGRPPRSSQVWMSLRKHPQQLYPLDSFVAREMLTNEQAVALAQAMMDCKVILISGGTGTGKTSLINATLHIMKDSPERLVVLQDQPEILVEVADCTRLAVTKGFTMRDLVWQALRMDPDRIVIGEVRGGEALDLLHACKTGHGGLCSIHAESAGDALLNLEHLVLEVSPDPQRALIAGAIDYIIHMEPHKSIGRCAGIWECHGLDAQGEYHLERIA